MAIGVSPLSRRAVAAVAAVAVVATVLLSASPASAHEVRTVGAYQLTVGWLTEPAYVGQTNAIEVFVHDAKGAPLDDLGPNGLIVTVVTGSQTSDPLPLTAGFDPDTGLGIHGQLLASIIPTAPGNYTFHITGDVSGQKIDQQFTSSDKTFNPVVDPTSVEFPSKNPTLGAVATGVSQLTPRVDAVKASAQSAASTARTARTIAVVGVVVGVLGLLVGLRRRA